MRVRTILSVLLATGLIACGGGEPEAEPVPEITDWTSFVYAPEDPDLAEQAMDVVYARLSSLGLTVMVKAEEGRVIVSLPSATPEEVRERALTLATRTGSLEFAVVAPEDIENHERQVREELGDGYKCPPDRYRWVEAASEVGLARLVEEPEREAWRFTGEDFDPDELAVRPGIAGPGFVVAFGVLESRAAEFEAFTASIVERPLAIIVDGRVESAPIVREKLPGKAQISGGGVAGFSKVEAEDLVSVLGSGVLPTKLTRVSEDEDPK